MTRSNIYSGSILVLGIVQLIESIAVSIPFSYFPNYAISLGASVAYIGLFTSSFMLAMAVAAPKLGSLSDRLGRKKIILWGLLGDVVLGIFTGLAPNWIWLLLIRALNGAVSAAAMLPAEALLIDLVSESRRGEASGFVMAMGMIGRSVGPVFGGSIQWMVHSSGLGLLDSYRFPYFVDSILAFLALFLVVHKISEPKRVARTRNMPLMKDAYMDLKQSKTELSLSIKILLITSFVTGIGVGFIMPISVLFYNDKFGIEPVEIGLILSITGIVGISAGWLAGRVSDKTGRKPIIALGGFASRFFSMALPLTFNLNQAAIVMAFRSLSFNIFMPAMRALRADIVSAESRGRIFGMFMMAFTAGDIIGPTLGTWLYSLYRFETFNLGAISFPGYGVPFLLYAILGLVSTTLILIFVKERQKT